MVSANECQIYLSSKAIANLWKFFDSIQIENKEAKSFKLIAKTIVISGSKSSSRRSKEDKLSETYAIDFNIISNRDDLMLVYENN